MNNNGYMVKLTLCFIGLIYALYCCYKFSDKSNKLRRDITAGDDPYIYRDADYHEKNMEDLSKVLSITQQKIYLYFGLAVFFLICFLWLLFQ